MDVPLARAGRFVAPLDRVYHPDDHTWVRAEGSLVRVGIDALGVETSGDLTQLFLLPPGTHVAAGDELGTIEAQKFVGPLRAPVSGTVVQINDRVVENPLLVNKDPYADGWLALIEPDAGADLAGFVAGDEIAPWFQRSLRVFEQQGSVAE